VALQPLTTSILTKTTAGVARRCWGPTTASGSAARVRGRTFVSRAVRAPAPFRASFFPRPLTPRRHNSEQRVAWPHHWRCDRCCGCQSGHCRSRRRHASAGRRREEALRLKGTWGAAAVEIGGKENGDVVEFSFSLHSQAPARAPRGRRARARADARAVKRAVSFCESLSAAVSVCSACVTPERSVLLVGCAYGRLSALNCARTLRPSAVTKFTPAALDVVRGSKRTKDGGRKPGVQVRAHVEEAVHQPLQAVGG
jgi:hypothetical protein